MYAYDVLNCITTGGSRHVKEFWKFYVGSGASATAHTLPTTMDYLRFMDVQLKCPNLTLDIVDIKLPENLSLFKRDVLVSKHLVEKAIMDFENTKFLYVKLKRIALSVRKDI
jgi:hypothetical protein